MVIRWDSATDQTLLLKILETSKVNVDSKAVAAAWPQNQEAPTPRAISERLFRLRALAKSSGTVTGASGRNSNPTTPRKVAARNPRAKRDGVKKSATKRKRREKDLDNSDTDEMEPFKEGTIHPDDDDANTNEEEVISPSRKTKRGAAIKSEPDHEKHETPMGGTRDGPLYSEGDDMTAEI
ncbi:hypothetical protein MMC07_000905 [Pseudocyphellaria aurata]|nr:hypothetical protein [Pseudocyphellaria aurata]